VGLVDLRRLVLVFYCCFVGFGICGILRSVAFRFLGFEAVIVGFVVLSLILIRGCVTWTVWVWVICVLLVFCCFWFLLLLLVRVGACMVLFCVVC